MRAKDPRECRRGVENDVHGRRTRQSEQERDAPDVVAKAEAAKKDEATIEISLQSALTAFGPEAVPHLVGDLQHKSRDMRWGAAANLGRLGVGAKDALGALEARAKEEADATVRERMTEAVAQIRGGG
jgi:HEAT repeat protein